MGLRFRVPHTLTLLFGMMVLALVATWIVPQGAFESELSPVGREVVIPGTFTVADTRALLTPWDLFTAIPRGFAAAQDIIFFILIIGGVLSIIRATGTVDALIGSLLERFGKQPGRLIFIVIFSFSLASGSIGSSGEYIPFVFILVGLCRAMRFDSMTAVAIIIAGYGIGYGMAAFNPFTVLIAQQIAEVDTYSGWPLRLSMQLPFVLIGVHHVWKYAQNINLNPKLSLVLDIENDQIPSPCFHYPRFQFRHRLILALFVLTLVVVVWGIASHGWYLNELGAAFLVLGLAVAFVAKLQPDKAAKRFSEGATELTTTALLVGFARCIALILEDGQILHTIVYGMSLPLSYLGPELAAIGMLIMQSILNLFIPSGSGQAFVTVPLMAPLGDLVGIHRQVVVLAYQFGDGFTNMIVPTNAVLMGILGMAGVPYGRWLRFCIPLFGKLMLAAAAVLVLTVLFGELWPWFFGTI